MFFAVLISCFGYIGPKPHLTQWCIAGEYGASNGLDD